MSWAIVIDEVEEHRELYRFHGPLGEPGVDPGSPLDGMKVGKTGAYFAGEFTAVGFKPEVWDEVTVGWRWTVTRQDGHDVVAHNGLADTAEQAEADARAYIVEAVAPEAPASRRVLVVDDAGETVRDEMVPLGSSGVDALLAQRADDRQAEREAAADEAAEAKALAAERAEAQAQQLAVDEEAIAARPA